MSEIIYDAVDGEKVDFSIIPKHGKSPFYSILLDHRSERITNEEAINLLYERCNSDHLYSSYSSETIVYAIIHDVIDILEAWYKSEDEFDFTIRTHVNSDKTSYTYTNMDDDILADVMYILDDIYYITNAIVNLSYGGFEQAFGIAVNNDAKYKEYWRHVSEKIISYLTLRVNILKEMIIK